MQGCVIYRDIDDGPKLTEVCDFVNKQGLDAMTSFMSGVYATGGADECESIASRLKVEPQNLAVADPNWVTAPFNWVQLTLRSDFGDVLLLNLLVLTSLHF